jgi:hypothetical protein
VSARGLPVGQAVGLQKIENSRLRFGVQIPLGDFADHAVAFRAPGKRASRQRNREQPAKDPRIHCG